MQYEEHPYPEHPFWRLGSPILALLLAAVAGAAMFVLADGVARTAVDVVVLVVQLGLAAGRGWYRRRSARRTDVPAVIHIFALLWTVYAVGGALVGSAPVDGPPGHVVEGLIFAVPLTLLFWWTERTRERRSATRSV